MFGMGYDDIEDDEKSDNLYYFLLGLLVLFVLPYGAVLIKIVLQICFS